MCSAFAWYEQCHFKYQFLLNLGDAGTRQRELHSRQFNSYHRQVCRVVLSYAWYDDIRQDETATPGSIGELVLSLASGDGSMALGNVSRNVSTDNCVHETIEFTIEPLVTHHLVLQVTHNFLNLWEHNSSDYWRLGRDTDVGRYCRFLSRSFCGIFLWVCTRINVHSSSCLTCFYLRLYSWENI